ncbi:hypothetical protein SKP09_004513 [Vibrio parahaemolyticus]|nr:hypothetical protein [Vibrio parahaemolyticus]
MAVGFDVAGCRHSILTIAAGSPECLGLLGFDWVGSCSNNGLSNPVTNTA